MMKKHATQAHYDLSSLTQDADGEPAITVRVAGKPAEQTSDPMMRRGVCEADKGNRCLSSAIVSGLPETPKPYNRNSADKKQVGQLTSCVKRTLQFIAKGRLNKQAAAEIHQPHDRRKTSRASDKKLRIRWIADLTHHTIYAGIVPCNPRMALPGK